MTWEDQARLTMASTAEGIVRLGQQAYFSPADVHCLQIMATLALAQSILALGEMHRPVPAGRTQEPATEPGES